MDKIMRKVILLAAAVGALLSLAMMYALAQAPSPGASGPATGTGYPAGAIPLSTAVSSADTSTSTASLFALPGRVDYVCGFAVSGLGATAATPVTVTVGQVVSGVPGLGTTLSYAYVFTGSATTINAPISTNFSPCLPTTAINTTITITVPGAAGNTSTNISLWGYAL
jgi:hypothetical protein